MDKFSGVFSRIAGIVLLLIWIPIMLGFPLFQFIVMGVGFKHIKTKRLKLDFNLTKGKFLLFIVLLSIFWFFPIVSRCVMAAPFMNFDFKFLSILLNMVFAYFFSCILAGNRKQLQAVSMFVLIFYLVFPKVASFNEGDIGWVEYQYCDCFGVPLPVGSCCWSSVNLCIGLCRRHEKGGYQHKSKARAEDANLRLLNTQIELYKIDTGFWPEFPNMESLLMGSTYFPDGPPRDPFTNEIKLGTYSLDMRDAPLHVRVYSEPHTVSKGSHVGYCGVTDCP